MFVKISAKAGSEAEADQLLEPVVAQALEAVGEFAYGRDVGSLEEKLVSILRKRRLAVATAESCTGGLVAKRLTDQPGASEIFHLGVVAYANEAKIRLLGVSQETLAKHGAVSRETAAEMALGVKNLAKSDFGIGVTGIAGPGGGTPEKPVGLVYVALAADRIHVSKLAPWGRATGRERVRMRAASLALDMLRRHLDGRPILAEV